MAQRETSHCLWVDQAALGFAYTHLQESVSVRDCHEAIKYISAIEGRKIIVRCIKVSPFQRWELFLW